MRTYIYKDSDGISRSKWEKKTLPAESPSEPESTSPQQLDTQRLKCSHQPSGVFVFVCVCMNIMMSSPAVVFVLQVTRSPTPAAALCEKSLADPRQGKNWQSALGNGWKKGGEAKVWKIGNGREASFSVIRFSDCCDTQTSLQRHTHPATIKIAQTERQRVLDGELHAEKHKPRHE